MNPFSGRYNRTTYWALVAMILVGLAIMAAMPGDKPPSVSEAVIAMVCVPRLHDTGQSGWMVMWGIGLEIVGAIASIALLPREYIYQGLGAVNLVALGLVIWLGSIPGQNFTNKFGDQPSAGFSWRKRKQP